MKFGNDYRTALKFFFRDVPNKTIIKKCKVCGKRLFFGTTNGRKFWELNWVNDKPTIFLSLSSRTTHVIYINSYICKKCRAKQFVEEKLSLLKNIGDRQTLLINCSKRGTCDIIMAHHEILKDDPERFTTEYLIGQVCGEEERLKYLRSVTIR